MGTGQTVSPFIKVLIPLKKLSALPTPILVNRHFNPPFTSQMIDPKYENLALNKSQLLHNLIRKGLMGHLVPCLFNGLLNSIQFDCLCVIKSDLSFLQVHLNILNAF